MPTLHRTGDLFAQSGLDPATSALAQGVNCKGVMGAGIAPVFVRRYGRTMLDNYAADCRSGALTVGGLHVWRSPDPADPWLYNLASQDRPGADARLEAIETSLLAAIDHAENHGITTILMPRIGAGIGGLAWADVKSLYDLLGAQTDVLLVSISLPDAD